MNACDALGELYRAGRGVDKGDARVRKLLDMACEMGRQAACTTAEP